MQWQWQAWLGCSTATAPHACLLASPSHPQQPPLLLRPAYPRLTACACAAAAAAAVCVVVCVCARPQVGGSDQWGNITAGTDLVRRLRGGRGDNDGGDDGSDGATHVGGGPKADQGAPTTCFGLTFPLLVGAGAGAGAECGCGCGCRRGGGRGCGCGCRCGCGGVCQHV